MEKNEEIKALLEKYIRDECNREEIELLIKFFQKNKSFTHFPSPEHILDSLQDKEGLSTKASDRIFNNVLSIAKEKDYEPPRPFYKGVFWKYAIAAIFIGVVVATFMGDLPLSINKENNSLVVEEEFVTLELENGSVMVLNQDSDMQVEDGLGNVIGSRNGNRIDYNGKADTTRIKFNTLRVPYGKRFEIKLSDGSFVYLNSGTSLRYPVSFRPGEKREVFLDGEAFFEVSADKDHPFIVNTETMDVEVLGTRFNVASYQEEPVVNVVLVEGAVAMYEEGKSIDSEDNMLLRPGYKGEFDKRETSLSQKMVMTSIYTSWINGELVFRNMEFGHILKKLERHYNIKIENRNKTLERETFNANFGNEPLEKVLEYLKTMYGIEYTVTGNQVLLKD